MRLGALLITVRRQRSDEAPHKHAPQAAFSPPINHSRVCVYVHIIALSVKKARRRRKLASGSQVALLRRMAARCRACRGGERRQYAFRSAVIASFKRFSACILY